MFLPVSQPPGDSWESEQDREETDPEAHCFIDETGVEVHVRIQHPFHRVLILEGETSKLESDVELPVPPRYLKDLVCEFLDHCGPTVMALTNPMYVL